MPILDRILAAIDRLFLVGANAALLAMLVVTALNIASRALFEQGLMWAFPISIVCFVWMTFLGFFVVYRQNKDITVDFLLNAMPAPARLAGRMLVDIAVIAFLLILLREAPELIQRQVGNIEMVGLQRYWLSIPFFVSCALIALHFLSDLVHALRGHAPREHHPVGDI
ncbi:TRAP transporter small permease [Nitratireductor sp. ZSWI3]|uniref:TRAP transporter small permease n=1 Tax=Nitratireductor sp. ZSWI3 TaxID=2966359 RepID=UPI00215047B6|nr:TRAP transporter small permease subunit [Nitratireductor sp. ZSWI3]MCR4267219.1 TRAP transporter small permease subunit [Nitratireductor sp. ZSWI3]